MCEEQIAATDPRLVLLFEASLFVCVSSNTFDLYVSLLYERLELCVMKCLFFTSAHVLVICDVFYFGGKDPVH